jgi:undecaprenyl phosphate N,N'-diacetylbacillosamine 1-phosphate transferase
MRTADLPSETYSSLKRLVDVMGAFFGLAIFSPVLLAVAILVRFKLGSPVFFTQERVGLRGKIFRLRKFRSMTNRTNSDGKLLPDDQRLTPFGVLLRSSSLDELPELWQVLTGNMSLVGPRPLPVRYLDRYSSEQKRRHQVRPGITGLAQINGRNSLSWADRFAQDIEYVENVSLRMDMSILFRTVSLVIRRDGIAEDGGVTMTEFTGTPECDVSPVPTVDEPAPPNS